MVRHETDARKAAANVPRMAIAASGGWFGGWTETRSNWQNMSIGVSKSVILGELRVDAGEAIPRIPLKTLSFRPEGHLPSVTWDSGPWSAIVQASWSSNQNSQTETRTI